jgi:hypothetical protein
MASALDSPLGDLDHMSKFDDRRPLVLTRSFKQFKDFLEKHIGNMTGARGNVFYGLKTRCRRDECTYELNTDEITAEGNCLFDSLLYMTGDARDERGHRVQDAECDGLRRQLVRHYIDHIGVPNGPYNLEEAVRNKESYTPTIIVESFVDIYKTNVIVFELFNDGTFNGQLFMNRTVPFEHVEFLILTQNPGHFTTLRKVRGFEQPRAFIAKLRSIPSDLGGTLGDMMVGEEASQAEQTYYQPLCQNYQHADEVFSTEVDFSEYSPNTRAAIQRALEDELPRPPSPRANSPKARSGSRRNRPRPKVRPPRQNGPHSIPPARIPIVPPLAPLFPLNHVYPEIDRSSGLAIGANLEARSGSKSPGPRLKRRLKSARAKSRPKNSPKTPKSPGEIAAIAAVEKATRNEEIARNASIARRMGEEEQRIAQQVANNERVARGFNNRPPPRARPSPRLASPRPVTRRRFIPKAIRSGFSQLFGLGKYSRRARNENIARREREEN